MVSFLYNDFDFMTSLSDSADSRNGISGLDNIPSEIERVPDGFLDVTGCARRRGTMAKIRRFYYSKRNWFNFLSNYVYY
jgi:hypothetical protein